MSLLRFAVFSEIAVTQTSAYPRGAMIPQSGTNLFPIGAQNEEAGMNCLAEHGLTHVRVNSGFRLRVQVPHRQNCVGQNQDGLEVGYGAKIKWPSITPPKSGSVNAMLIWELRRAP